MAPAASTIVCTKDILPFHNLREGVPPPGHNDALPVGAVVRLGVAHPCTAVDKWKLIPVIDNAESANLRIVDFIPTYF